VTTRLVNGYLRHDRDLPFGRLYTLVEGSVSSPAESGAEGYFSVLGEAQLTRGPHQPYLRLEFATRPEYAREGIPGTDGFFRYDHDSHAIGATRWFIATAGYGSEATRLPFSARPFAEIGYHNAVHERGNMAPRRNSTAATTSSPSPPACASSSAAGPCAWACTASSTP
jgi:hypothetical protein